MKNNPLKLYFLVYTENLINTNRNHYHHLTAETDNYNTADCRKLLTVVLSCNLQSHSQYSYNKIKQNLFVSDEYTRITTPRQDVLFKKGYLNKPKTYQTQTSTGTSTNSTGNSTGNGTPDHQSAGKTLTNLFYSQVD